MATVPHAARRERTDVVAAALIAAGATSVLFGLWAFLSPGSFYDVIAAYPPRNDHFLRDIGSFEVGLGAAALYGARRAAWRTPMLGIVAVQYALHAISHLIDVDATDPKALGVVNFVLLTTAAVALAALFVREHGR